MARVLMICLSCQASIYKVPALNKGEVGKISKKKKKFPTWAAKQKKTFFYAKRKKKN